MVRTTDFCKDYTAEVGITSAQMGGETNGATQRVILWDMGKKRKYVTNVYGFMFKS